MDWYHLHMCTASWAVLHTTAARAYSGDHEKDKHDHGKTKMMTLNHMMLAACAGQVGAWYISCYQGVLTLSAAAIHLLLLQHGFSNGCTNHGIMCVGDMTSPCSNTCLACFHPIDSAAGCAVWYISLHSSWHGCLLFPCELGTCTATRPGSCATRYRIKQSFARCIQVN